MISYLQRLGRSLAAYQVADVVSKFIAVLLLPVYTRYIHPAEYGEVELLANGVIFVSIVVRFGMIEAFLRYYFTDADQARRDALARRAVLFMLLTTTVVSIALAAAAAPLSKLVLGHQDTTLFLIAVLGLWSFTNLELAYGAAARRRAGAHVRDRVADQRRADDRRVGRAGRRPREGRATDCCSATTAPRRWCCSGCGGRCDTGCCRGTARAPSGSGAACASACRRCPPRRRCTRSASSTATTSTTPAARRWPGSTRSRSSSPARSRSSCARSSTRGRRSPTRSPTTPRPRGCTASSRPTTCSSAAGSSPGSRCSDAGCCGCWRPPRSTARTRRCRGSRSAGRCTGCGSCSW